MNTYTKIVIIDVDAMNDLPDEKIDANYLKSLTGGDSISVSALENQFWKVEFVTFHKGMTKKSS